ncbi:Glyoxylase, beta-lactamase superfamily II [Ruminococcus sp. YE71]|uniref:MBL fold metallo-hydrolase n=1 Tax=unclassified Ruminococcus TaxID=2608920 RepID=UPI000889B630|nr:MULTISPECIES: MBL fold metallo-hydrolase [unclassified Ruminococcus]SDA23761.1 Glyoxylase, beta-lactamase superfamily II [Ruminococcus sp. YE78]SFW40470.1 Glyoxylase, beta-lactamase superfamily II [Ruminococcus sp. YE71]
MELIKLDPLSVCDTNSYIVAAESGSCVLIDAPADADYIYNEITKRHLVLKKILLTHGHFDHVGAVADLVDKTGCEVYIHEADYAKLALGDEMLGEYFRVRGCRTYGMAETVADGDIIKLDELEFDVVHTPGHTSGSVCYIIGDVMFSGDTLFCRSVGRTDLPDGDPKKLMQSLKVIWDLGGNLRILPGHMDETSLDAERVCNIYLKQAGR